jgi:hypothetical protein
MIRTKLIAFTICIFYFVACKSQDKTKELEFPQVHWTLIVPENSNFFTASQFDSLKNAIEKKANQHIALSQPDVLFIIKKDMYNYFGSSVTALDTSNFKTWQSSYNYQKKAVIDLIKSKESSISLLDTASAIENIDGLTFQKFYLKTSYPSLNLILENYWYYRLQNGLEFSINITFNDKEVGKSYLSLLRASKFDK